MKQTRRGGYLMPSLKRLICSSGSVARNFDVGRVVEFLSLLFSRLPHKTSPSTLSSVEGTSPMPNNFGHRSLLAL
jgi:hypothetical protein